MKVIYINVGGPMRKISVNGKIYDFEMHPYCGPTLLDKNEVPVDLNKHPKEFLEAASLWAQQGQRIEDGLCRWDLEPKAILKHAGGRHWRIVGYEPTEKGK